MPRSQVEGLLKPVLSINDFKYLLLFLMIKGNFKQIDLLRKRRESNDLTDPYFIDTKKYIKKGISSGLILISILLYVISNK